MRGGVVKVSKVAPSMGWEVSPVSPRYHWNVGEEPDAATVSVTVPPLMREEESGWVVMAGGANTVAVTVSESAFPAALLARTQ